MLKIVILTISFLFAFAENNSSKEIILNFIKKYAKEVYFYGNFYEYFITGSPAIIENLTIDDLSNIYYLNLSNSNLTEIPKEIEYLNNLKLLDLSYNKLKTLPKEMENMNLSFLFLFNNDLREIPKEVFKAFKIKVDKEKLTPFALNKNRYYKMFTLYDIDISNNKLSYLPKEICKINGIRTLEFNNNYFDEIPRCLSNLKDFYLELNDFYTTTPLGEKFYGRFDFIKWKMSPLASIEYEYKSDKEIEFKVIFGDEVDVNQYIFVDGYDLWGDKYEDKFTSYVWNFGDKNISTEETPIHTYSNYGDYNVTLTLNSGELNASKLISLHPRVLELKKGWNMVTPPSKDDINATLFEIVWSYENETWDNNHSFLKPTIGYWVKLNQDLNYSYSGEVYKLPNYKIKNGWNFIGSGEKYFKKKNQTIYQFKNKEWLINPNEIKAGEGFWVNKN